MLEPYPLVVLSDEQSSLKTDLKCTEFLLNRCETEVPSLIFNVCALVSLFGGIEERACLFVTDLIRTLGMFETITSWLTTLVSA